MFFAGAQDILKVFLQASAAKGEWIAALQSFSSVSASKKEPIHSLLLCEAFSKGNQWEKAFALCQETLDLPTVSSDYAAKGYGYVLQSYIRGLCSPLPSTVVTSSSSIPLPLRKREEEVSLCLGKDQTNASLLSISKEEAIPSPRTVAMNIATAGWNAAVQCEDKNVAVECATAILHCCQEHVFPHLSPPYGGARCEKEWEEKLEGLKQSCAYLSCSTSPSVSPPLRGSTSISSLLVTARASSVSCGASPSAASRTIEPRRQTTSGEIERTLHATRPSQNTLLSEQDSALERKIIRLLQQPKTRNAWKTACEVFFQISRPRPSSFHALLQCLGRQGRVTEAERIVLELFQYHMNLKRGTTAEEEEPHRYASLRLSRRLLQDIADCATRLHSTKICEAILLERLFSALLTPSTAIVLLSFLSHSPSMARKEWRLVMKWWEDEVQQWKKEHSDGLPPNHEEGGPHKGGYSLCTHLQVSSFVGKCIIQGSRSRGTSTEWRKALACFTYSEDRNPDLALLFQLRLLRVAKEWKAALELFSPRLEAIRSSASSTALPLRGCQCKPHSVLHECCSMFLYENPSAWIPEDVLACLQQQIRESGIG